MTDSTIYLSARAAAFSIDSILSAGEASNVRNTRRIRTRGKKRKSVEDMPPSIGVSTGYIKQEQDFECESVSKHKRNQKCDEIRVELQHQQLWQKFHSLGTEMIITKVGRRMFPTIRVKVDGLQQDENYYIIMDIVPVDDKRYRYAYHSSQWFLSGDSDVLPPDQERIYIHPDSPSKGSSWHKQVLAFDKIKLTNNDTDSNGHIILQSMKKYQPRIHIIKANELSLTEAKSLVQCDASENGNNDLLTFVFPETRFITVTAYQNQQLLDHILKHYDLSHLPITKLKIDRNPFAKGFRDLHRYRQGDLETSSTSEEAASQRDLRLSPAYCDRHVAKQQRPISNASKEECSHSCYAPRMSPCSPYHPIKMSRCHEPYGKLHPTCTYDLPPSQSWGICRSSGRLYYRVDPTNFP